MSKHSQISAQIVRSDSDMTQAPLTAGAVEATAAWTPESWVAQWNLSSGAGGVRVDAIADQYTGAGVRVAVIDDGFDYRHGELANAYLTDLDLDARGNDSDAAAEAGDNHGTAVMGVIGAAVGNGGARGVAPGAGLIGVRIGYGSAWSIGAETKALTYAAANADVVNMSYGVSTPFGDSYAMGRGVLKSIFATGVETGRHGLGTVFVFSAGNERTDGMNTNTASTKCDPNVIVVAATDYAGNVANFSTPGASILVAAPGVSVLTTDRTGADGWTATDFALANGTSFSAPTVTGIVALMLQANPYLGFRDVQEILALTATRSAANTVWAVNGSQTWNGGGMHTSNDLGFGLVNAEAAVHLAEMWGLRQTAANDVAVSVTQAAAVALRDNGSVTSTITVPATDRLDHVDTVQVTLNISHARPSDLVVTLTGPSGTTVTLVNRPANGTSASGIVFDTSATAFRGEQESGTWTLTVTDKAAGTTGTLNGWSLNLIGDQATVDTLYVYTDEYGAMWTAERAVLRDTDGGTDTLMLAALSGNAVIDLAGGTGSIAGKAFAVDAATRIERVILGAGNDRVTGSASDDLILGNRGADTLTGGAGLDHIEGGTGNDSLTGGAGADDLLGGAGCDVFCYDTALDGGDMLRDFSLTDGDRIDPTALLLAIGWAGSVAEAVTAGRFALTSVTGGAVLALDANGLGAWVSLVTIAGLAADVAVARLFDLGGTGGGARPIFTFGDADSGVWGTGSVWGAAGTHYQLFDAAATLRALSLDLTTGLLITNGKSASSSGIVVDAVQAGAGNDTLSGAALDDNLRGGAGNDVLTGRDGNDALLGEAGNDKLDGGAGTDRLDGGDGNDTLLAGDGADLLAGGSGADSLTAGTGNDSLSGGDANDTLDAGAGNDSILGGVGNDAILGGDGDDWAEGNEGADSLTAGIGNDTLSAGADTDKLLGEAGLDSLSGGDGNDSLDGGLGNDTLLGDAGNDTLIGGDDADRLMGGAGADALTGGKGADVFVVDADGGDTILDWSVLDGDRLDLTGVLASLSYSGSDAFADGVLVWKQGATGAVLWAGSVALVTLTGKFAADTQLLAGTSPDSTYQFRDGMLAGQRATLTDATGIDRIDLSLLGSGVTLDMNAAKGGLIAGGTLVLGSGVIENITGTEFDDVLTGNVAGNVMFGGAGADVLSGGSGNDMLTGGAGLDRLNGGIGADVFRLSTEAAADRIDDFKTTEGDRLDLTDVLATLGLTLAGAVSANRIVLEQDSLGSSLRVDLGGAGEYITIAWLAGVSGATAIANLVSGAKTTAPPMLVRTDVAVAAMAEAGDISWNVLKAADWTPTGGSLTTSTGLTAYDLSQVAGAALVTMATGTGTLKGATLAFRGAVTDLITGDLADKITTGTGADRVWSLGGNDTLTGGTGNNLLSGGAGEDSLRAAAGQDSLFGGAGNDKIYGEDGNDSLLGDVGNDLLDGGTGTDLILGGEGRDTLMGQAGHDTLSGGSDNDSLDGGTDNDLLTGEAGDDTLLGGTGNDTLQGDDGADKLTGGTGADRFVFASLVGCDLVTDFKATDGDRLDLSGIVDDFGFASTQDALAHGALRVMVVGTATCVQIAGSDGAWVNVALLDKIIAPSLVPEWLA